MNENNLDNFKHERIKETNELNKRWNDKFLSDIKENRNNRILFMQNLSTIVTGLIGAGIFFDKIKGIYSNISFVFAISTVLLIILYLRESLDKELNDGYKLLKQQHKLIDKYKKEVQKLDSREEHLNLSASFNKKPANSKNYLLDCSGEFINFFFISTLFFLGFSLFSIPFEYCYIFVIILSAFIISFLPTYSIIVWPFRYLITMIKKYYENRTT